MPIRLEGAEYELELAPERGGAVSRLDWCSRNILRPVCGPSITDVACFPLVPFSNRIAWGRFQASGQTIRLSPNLPGAGHPHALHGFGWLSAWRLVERSAASATIEYSYQPGEWPWPFLAWQQFSIEPKGVRFTLSVKNLGEMPMPAGLGFHPYFVRDMDTIYRSLHRGEWLTSEDGLPIALNESPDPVDWWEGRPVGERIVDRPYTGRSGNLILTWPARQLEVVLTPSAELDVTYVFTPESQNFFCVEPVTHAVDAHNRDGGRELQWLEPGATFTVSMVLRASVLNSPAA